MKRIFCFMVCILGIVPVVHAKLYVAKSMDKFFVYINTRHKVGIAHFNPFSPEEETPELELMKEAFVELSKEQRYKEADMSFVGVNLQELPELADLYNIPLPTMEAGASEVQADEDDAKESANVTKEEKVTVVSDMKDLPESDQSTLILFKNGKPLKSKGEIVKLEGIASKRQMRDFIEDNIGSFIDTLLLERQQEQLQQQQQLLEARQQQLARQQQQAQQQTVVYQRPQRTTYVYYPGRTYRPPYYRRPYWGRGYGYGRPYYRRRWWGPGFGIGFGFGGRRGWGGFGFGW